MIKGALLLVGVAILMMATPAQEPKVSVREFVSLAGTVDRIDRGSRTLTVKVDDRFTQSLYVPPEFKVFDELNTGDRVVAKVRESVVVSARPGLKPRLPSTTSAASTQQQTTAVVTIEVIDRTTNWITYKTADNRRIVRAVGDPKLLDGLKPGDLIEVTLTRETVIELQRR